MAGTGKRLLHNVFFTLNDGSEAKKTKLVDDCYRYLEGAAGALSFFAGPRRGESTRGVNDLEFDVALTILFDSADAHDSYQVWEKHAEFIAANTANWKQVRVFDAEIG